jgi:hypothetical protein
MRFVEELHHPMLEEIDRKEVTCLLTGNGKRSSI